MKEFKVDNEGERRRLAVVVLRPMAVTEAALCPMNFLF